MISEQLREQLEMMIKLRKNPNRMAGCPVWDKMTLDLWITAAAGNIDSDREFVIQSELCMDHCKHCSHPMCNTPDLDAFKQRDE